MSTAVALERLRLAHQRSREKHAAYRALTAAFFTMPLDDVRKWVKPRHFEVALMHLGGYDTSTIARACGYRDRVRIEQILKRPEIARYVALIREAQEARVIAGEFGVRAASKAAAPKAMKRIIDDGQDAPKAADRHANNRTVLQVAGELVDRHEHHHVVELMRGLSRAELVALSERDEWPVRLVEQVRALGLGTGKALPAPDDEDGQR